MEKVLVSFCSFKLLSHKAVKNFIERGIVRNKTQLYIFWFLNYIIKLLELPKIKLNVVVIGIKTTHMYLRLNLNKLC